MLYEIGLGIVIVLASGAFAFFIAKYISSSKKSKIFERPFESIKSTIDETLIAAKNIDEINELGVFLLGYVSAFKVMGIITDDEFKALNIFINDMARIHVAAMKKLEEN